MKSPESRPRITESSSEYQQREKELKELGATRSWIDGVGRALEEKPGRREEDRLVGMVRRNFKQLWVNPGNRSAVIDFFPATSHDLSAENSMEEFEVFIDAVSEDVFVELIHDHQERMEVLEGLFLGRIIEKAGEIEEKFGTFFEKNSSSLTSEECRRRLAGITYYVLDPLGGSGEAHGGHDPRQRVVSVDHHLEGEEFEDALAHEMVHAISGRTLLGGFEGATPLKEIPDLPQTLVHPTLFPEIQRSGLNFQETPNPRFSWLSEAVTETFALLVLGRKNSKAYGYERELLYSLLKEGTKPISFKTITDAYFENFDADAPPGEKVPGWHSFSEAIAESFVPGFLVALDKYIKEHGIEKAFEVFSKNRKEIL